METKTGIEKDLLKKIKKLSVIKNLVKTVIVDDPKEEVIIKKTSTINNIKTTWKEKITPKLKKHNLIYKNSGDINLIITDEVNYKTILSDKKVCDCVSSRINREFLLDVKNFNDIKVKEWKFFNRNIISRCLFPKDKKKLINKIIEKSVDFDWIIISPKILNYLKSTNYFYTQEIKDSSIITNVGILKFDNLKLDVFLDNELEKEKIWFGNYNSVTLILKDKLDVKKLNSTSFSIGIDYQFIKTGDILLLTV